MHRYIHTFAILALAAAVFFHATYQPAQAQDGTPHQVTCEEIEGYKLLTASSTRNGLTIAPTRFARQGSSGNRTDATHYMVCTW